MNYVCLDVGNVLVHVDFKTFINSLSEQLNITIQEAEYFMNRTHALHDMGLTKMEDELRDHFKIKSPIIIKKLLESWNNVIVSNFSMVAKMVAMQHAGVQVALLSNVGLEHSIVMSKALSWGRFFDKCVKHLSCEVGARKPSKLYYQSFLLQHPEFKGAAYLDDLHENLKIGKEFGFRPFHFSLELETSCGSGLCQVSSRKLEEIAKFIESK